MQKLNNSMSDTLNKEQEQTLLVLLHLIIPSSEDGRMPDASDVGFADYIRDNNLLPWVREGLLCIAEESQNKYGENFPSLSESEQQQLIDSLRRKLFRFFTHLTTYVIECYYQNDRVLKAIGLEPRAPFPQGYVLEDGDLTLLELVYERGKIYRD